MSYFPGQLRLADGPNVDAFGRLRGSDPHTVFDSHLVYGEDLLRWQNTQVSGSGGTATFNTNQASVTIAQTAAVGRFLRQSYGYFNYQPGKSQLVLLTGIIGAATANATKRIGLFDDSNGLFFEMTGSGLAVVRRTFTSGSTVDNSVAQASWNLDPMNGSGPSGITLDPTKVQIFLIDYEWLGSGRIRMGLVINGVIYYVHQFLVANVLTVVWAGDGNLPLRWEVITTSATTASITVICCTVISEGGLQETGRLFGVDRGVTPLVTLNDTSIYPLILVRLKTTHRSATVTPRGFSISCTSSSLFRFKLIANPTIVGVAPVFSSVNAYSAVEACVNLVNTTTITAGTGAILQSGYTEQVSDSNLEIPLPSSSVSGGAYPNTPTIYALAVQRVTGTTETFYASLFWRELW